MSRLGLIAVTGLLAISGLAGFVAGAEEDGVTIPHPRAGQVHVVGPHTWMWGDEVLEIADSWGVRREVVALNVNAWYGYNAYVSLDGAFTVATELHDETTRSTDISHLRDRRATNVEGLLYPQHGHITIGLMGKTLAPGDVVTTTPGHDWSGHYRAVGWEDVDGEPLFRVEVEHVNWGQTSLHTFWYDGEHPVPSRALWFGTELRLLTSVGGDPSAPRLEPSRPMDPFPAVHVDATWVPLTRDGPAEPMRAGFTLQEAVAAFRETFPTWLAANPDAYLVEASYDVEDPVFVREFMEPTRTGHDTIYSWELVYAMGTEGRAAKIYKPAFADSPPVVVWTGSAYYGLPMRPFADYDGKMVSCGAHADRIALDAAEGLAPDVRTGKFELTRFVQACSASHATKGRDVSYGVTSGGAIADAWDVQEARIHPFTGRLGWHFDGTASAEYLWVGEEDGQNHNGCDDLRDNDGDGRVDFLDAGCYSSGNEGSDSGCWDGYNNDTDIYPDWPLDPDCESPWDLDESS